MPDPIPAAPAAPAAPALATPAAPALATPAAAAAAPVAPASPAPAAGATPPAAPAAGATPAAPPAAPAAPETPKPGESAAPALDIKLPEGVKVDQAVLDGFKSIAKEHGLSPKQAQALVDFQLKNSQEQQAKASQMYQEALQKQRVADLDAIKADPKLGGANFDKTVREYRAAVQKFGGEDLRKMLEASGYDCHPAIVRTFQAVSAAIGEDSTTSRITQTTTTDSQRKPMSQTERMAARYNKNSSAQQ